MTKPRNITMDTMLEAMPIVAPPQNQEAFDAMLAEAEADLKAGPFAAFVRVKMGRPRKTEAAAPSVVKAVRLPVALLEELQNAARGQGLSLNAVLQMASAEWLTHHQGQ
jgi:hypothetical protein